MKKCTRCQETFPIENFYFSNKKKNVRHIYCKKCSSNACKKRRNKNYKLTWCKDTVYNHASRGCKVNFKPRELLEYIQDKTHCCYCDKPIIFSKDMTPETKASLDRFDNDLELNIEDIRICCWKCNTTKQDLTFHEFVEFCAKIRDKYEGLQDL